VVRELESLTGLEVAHAAAVDLAGFQTIVDALGGYEICTDHPLRDSKSGLSLPAGCTDADGATTLAWIRSRRTQQEVDGRWQTVPAVSDLTRNERQRIFMVDMFERIAADSDPRTILGVLREAAPHLTVDDGLSLREAAVWAWRFRGADVQTADIPVADHRTSAGAAVLVPTVDIATHVADITR
jgi:LCP family protein required for cell wall assembly